MNPKNIFFISLLTLLSLSCSKDDDTMIAAPDLQNASPTISFVSPTNGSGSLWNMVQVQVNAEDGDGSVAKVEFFVNGTKEAETTAMPYTFDWNSKNSNDGAVELKATVTDDEGATATTAITVDVLNVLIDYDLYDGYLFAANNIINYTYITNPNDEEEILYLAEITDGNFTEKVQRPDNFEGETFDIHFLSFLKDNENYGKIVSYHNITPGVFRPAPDTSSEIGNPLGQAKVTFTEVPGHDYALIFSGSNTNPIAEGSERSFDIFQNLGLGYVYLQVGNAGYYSAINFGVGDHVLPLNAMNSAMQGYSFTDSGQTTEADLKVFGHTGPGRFSPAVTVYTDNALIGGGTYEANFHLPKGKDGVFHHYHTNAALREKERTYVHEAFNGVLTAMTKLDANLMVTNSTLSQLDITASSSDTIDYVKADFVVQASDTFTFDWTSFSKDDSIRFPKIPTEVVVATDEVFNSSDIVFKAANARLLIEDLNDVNGYSDYLDLLSGRKEASAERNERLTVFEFFE